MSDGSSARPCFAVIFTSQHASAVLEDSTAYEETADAMVELAKQQPGFLGIESARNPDGFGITVSYWDSLEAIASWKAQAEHQRAQAQGRKTFYARYQLKVCTVERAYDFTANGM